MRRQIAAVLCSAALGVVAVSSLAIAQQKTAGSGKATGDRQVYSSVKDIMESIIDPSADVLWGAVGTVVDKQGIQELAPKTQEEWRDLRRAAVRIIEGGNLLIMPGREAAPAGAKSDAPGVELEPAEITVLINKKRKNFNAFSRALQALGVEALRASEAKNTDLVIEIGGRMEDVCESCHKTFWYPQEKRAATRN
jgi:thiamine pyrophosphate-dependent acetolactate synthase large subunit-like protein